MARESPWGAPTEEERWLAGWTLLTFASPDGILTAAERKILRWAGGELGFRVDDRRYDLLQAAGIQTQACRKELIRTIVLLVEAKGGPTANDLAVLAHLTTAWSLPEPEIVRRKPEDRGEGAPDIAALAVARAHRLSGRAQAIEAACSGLSARRWAIARMVLLAWGFYIAAGLAISALQLPLPAGYGAPYSSVVQWARDLRFPAFVLGPPLLAGFVLGLRGPLLGRAVIGGFLAWAIPALVIAVAEGAVPGSGFRLVVRLVPVAPDMRSLAAEWCTLVLCFAGFSAVMGFMGVHAVRWFRDRPR